MTGPPRRPIEPGGRSKLPSQRGYIFNTPTRLGVPQIACPNPLQTSDIQCRKTRTKPPGGAFRGQPDRRPFPPQRARTAACERNGGQSSGRETLTTASSEGMLESSTPGAGVSPRGRRDEAASRRASLRLGRSSRTSHRWKGPSSSHRPATAGRVPWAGNEEYQDVHQIGATPTAGQT